MSQKCLRYITPPGSNAFWCISSRILGRGLRKDRFSIGFKRCYAGLRKVSDSETCGSVPCEQKKSNQSVIHSDTFRR